MKQYKCPLCHSYPYKLYTHLVRYHQFSNDTGHCAICLTEQPKLINHIIENHLVDTTMKHVQPMRGRGMELGQFKCSLCSKMFSTKATRERHAASKHKMGASYKCVCCDYFNFRRDTMREHLISQHQINNSNIAVRRCLVAQCGVEVTFLLDHVMREHVINKGNLQFQLNK